MNKYYLVMCQSSYSDGAQYCLIEGQFITKEEANEVCERQNELKEEYIKDYNEASPRKLTDIHWYVQEM